MKVRYSYLKQQFSNSSDLWIKLKKFVSTGDFTLGKELYKFEKNVLTRSLAKQKSCFQPKNLLLSQHFNNFLFFYFMIVTQSN